MSIPRFLLIFFFLLLFGCASQPFMQSKGQKTEELQKEAKPPNTGYMLRFREKKPDEPERNVRMIITDQFLRIDEGRASEDFILFNRTNKTIAHITKHKISIQDVNPDEHDVNPAFPLQWLIESQTSQALMRTQDNNQTSATHYRFYLNEEPCYNLVAIESHLTGALDALREYNQVQANELKRHYRADKGQQCSEAIKIFDPGVRLQYGFPLREWSNDGYQRFLVDYQKDVIFPALLFRLPNDDKNTGF